MISICNFCGMPYVANSEFMPIKINNAVLHDTLLPKLMTTLRMPSLNRYSAMYCYVYPSTNGQVSPFLPFSLFQVAILTQYNS